MTHTKETDFLLKVYLFIKYQIELDTKPRDCFVAYGKFRRTII